jgi:hypothetical protein
MWCDVISWGSHNQLLLRIWKLLELGIFFHKLFLGCMINRAPCPNPTDIGPLTVVGNSWQKPRSMISAEDSMDFPTPLSHMAGSSGISCLQSSTPAGHLAEKPLIKAACNTHTLQYCCGENLFRAGPECQWSPGYLRLL